MPYKWQTDKIKLPREADRRVKITDEKKKEVHTLFEFEKMAQRAIARQTGISRRMISFILFPDKYAVARKQFIERRKDGRYKPSKEEWAKTIREHRHYKQKVIKSNKPK